MTVLNNYVINVVISVLYEFQSTLYYLGLQSDVMVGLRLSDHGYGKSNHIGGQQHMEQHTYLQGGTGMVSSLSHTFLDKEKEDLVV